MPDTMSDDNLPSELLDRAREVTGENDAEKAIWQLLYQNRRGD